MRPSLHQATAPSALTSLVSVALLSGCFVGKAATEYDRVVREVERSSSPRPRVHNHQEVDEQELARQANLPTILRLALARNPDIAETRERVRAALLRVKSASRLPDLEFKYEQWLVPLARPYALDQANMLMFGLQQQFPAPGTLGARSAAAAAEAGMSLEAARARSLDIVAEVRRSYYDLYRIEEEYRIHLEHVRLADEIVELARANYRVGKGTQQDVLRTMVELSKLRNDVVAIEQERLSMRAMLNTLMARAVDAPLGAPTEFKPTDVQPRLAELERDLARQRPELASAVRAVDKDTALALGARRMLYWPSLMIGLNYMYAPKAPADMTQNGYGAMVSFNLPWINPKRWEDVSEAEHTLAADRHTVESQRNLALYQLRDALAKLEAARQSLSIIDRELLPQSMQSFESSRSAFSSGQGDAIGLVDAFRSYLAVRIDRARALARVQSSLADLDRAAGLELASPSPRDAQ